jgi:hypothetical protein
VEDIAHSSDEFEAGFPGALGRLQVSILDACRRQDTWPAKVAAGVAAAADFAATEPETARMLTIQALIQRPDGGRRYMRMIQHFAELLGAEAPRDRRRPVSTERALVGGVATTIADHIREETLGDLRAEVPALVELVLVPYLGQAEARRWASREARARGS